MSMVGGRYTLEVESIAVSDWDAWVGEFIRMDCPGDSTCDTIHVVMHFGIENDKITGIDGFPVDTYAWEYVLGAPR
jgi:hypothetical protein